VPVGGTDALIGGAVADVAHDGGPVPLFAPTGTKV
jgi:hypothetical protein